MTEQNNGTVLFVKYSVVTTVALCITISSLMPDAAKKEYVSRTIYLGTAQSMGGGHQKQA
jgi:hypothetical protein